MSATIKVEGLQELEAKLVELGLVGSPKSARAAIRGAVAPVLDDAKRLVPKRTGALYDSLAIAVKDIITGGGKGDFFTGPLSNAVAVAGLRIGKVKEGLVGTSGVRGARPDPRRYWHLVEFGTSRAAAHPFIRPAFDVNVSKMIDEVKARLAKAVERAARWERRNSV